MIERAIDALVQTGLVVESGGGTPTLIRVSTDGIAHSFVIESRKRAPYPNEVHTLVARRSNGHATMLVAPYISSAVGEALIAAGWSWADAEGNFDICGSGLRWRQRVSTTPKRPVPRLPRGRAGCAIIRWLLVRADLRLPISQRELARVAGVSQPRVSQILARLVELDFVSRRGRHLSVTAFEPLLDRFVEGEITKGTTAYGRTDDSLSRMARMAAEQGVAVSVDVGLEHVASYPEPSVLVLYGAGEPDWSELDAEAAARDEANLIWRSPEDLNLPRAKARGFRE